MRLGKAGFMLVGVAVVVLGCAGVNAQAGGNAHDLAGTWVYRIGPNPLFVLQLEEPGGSQQLHGFLLRPEHFQAWSPGGSVIRFSKIENRSKREAVTASGWQNGVLRLAEDNPSAQPEDRDVFLVRPVDATHIDFTLFGPLPALRMERASGQPQVASDWDITRSYSPEDFLPDNAEMARIVAADQADRKDGVHIDWTRVKKADEERQRETAALLREGKLHTGQDFASAALVFQHGEKPDDYLLAHVLAMVAISKGQSGAVWISAATLDRYLQSIHQPQIFGTQFNTPDGKPTTQEPYDRGLISDSLRGEMGVPTEAEQETQRQHYDAERGIGAAKEPARH